MPLPINLIIEVGLIVRPDISLYITKIDTSEINYVPLDKSQACLFSSINLITARKAELPLSGAVKTLD